MVAAQVLSPWNEYPRTASREAVDHIVHLHDVSWEDYERILEIRGEKSSPRITYLEGELELLSPSMHHEMIKSLIGCLVEVYCLEFNIEFTTVGSWTVKNKKKKRGAEPDECYLFGRKEDPKRPDLAIEVIWTSGGLDKLDVYRKLNVREVWVWRKDRIHVYLLDGETYRAIEKSEALPDLDFDELLRHFHHPTTSAAIRAYRAALSQARQPA